MVEGDVTSQAVYEPRDFLVIMVLSVSAALLHCNAVSASTCNAFEDIQAKFMFMPGNSVNSCKAKANFSAEYEQFLE